MVGVLHLTTVGLIRIFVEGRRRGIGTVRIEKVNPREELRILVVAEPVLGVCEDLLGASFGVEEYRPVFCPFELVRVVVEALVESKLWSSERRLLRRRMSRARASSRPRSEAARPLTPRSYRCRVLGDRWDRCRRESSYVRVRSVELVRCIFRRQSLRLPNGRDEALRPRSLRKRQHDPPAACRW